MRPLPSAAVSWPLLAAAKEIVKALRKRRGHGANARRLCQRNSPEQFVAQIKSDFDRWGKLIKSLGVHVD